jgi:hypothetical protein
MEEKTMNWNIYTRDPKGTQGTRGFVFAGEVEAESKEAAIENGRRIFPNYQHYKATPTVSESQRYAVIRQDNGPQNPHTGIVSCHRTPAAAFAAIDKANTSLRRQRGYENSWHPYAVLDRSCGITVER